MLGFSNLLPSPPWEGPPLPRGFLADMAGRRHVRTFIRPHMSNIGNPVKVHTDVPKPIKVQPMEPRVPMPVWPTRQPVRVGM